MRVAIIKNNVVENVCVVDKLESGMIASDSANIGDQVLDGVIVITEPTPPTNAEKKAQLIAEITAVEIKELMPRGAREAFIALCLQQGQAAGLNPTQLALANPFFKGLKDTDAIAASLRAQIKAL